MSIQVLYFEGCPNYESAVDLVRSLAGNEAIETIEIRTQEEAVRRRFLGSPTILVDGVDVEPGARTRIDFGFTCRTYDGGGVPSRQHIASAIDGRSRRFTVGPSSRWLAGSSVVVAAIATACCWLPLLLLGLGISIVGSSASIDAYQPWLLAGSTILLAFGFHSAYRKQSCCAPQTMRMNRAMVWLAAGCVVVFALLPLYAEVLVNAADGSNCCSSGPSACCTLPQAGESSAESVLVKDEKTPVTVLSEDVHELKDAFNTDRNSPRVMLIVSPRCPACRAGARLVQKEALAETKSDALKVYVVWIKRFPGDSLEAAEEATELVPDRRARHFWDGSGALGKQFGKAIRLPNNKKFAWDVYFVFGPDAEWADSPPTPVFWMHQLGGRDTGNLLDGGRFRDAIRERLP
jgi:hypothetical protein